jgi:putative PIN family toxin of toxin-antitoxin system
MTKVVIDTNCLLVSVKSYSRRYWLWQAFLNGKITLCYTTEILLEYFEILSRYYDVETAKYIINTIINADNSMQIADYFRWRLITADPDDNKFVDCAITAGASYLVSNDRHFEVLAEISFPKVNVITIDEFRQEI